MNWGEILLIIMMPFVGTVIGSSSAIFLGERLAAKMQNTLLGFAAGVMVAASVWSLLIPAINEAEAQAVVAWVPALVGFIGGILFMLLLDMLTPHLHPASNTPEGMRTSLGRSAMLMLAVTLHNIPEGMAVGVVVAGALSGQVDISTAGAVTLALGIALQNVPEGAIISLPLRASGNSRLKSLAYGTASGIVEPLASIVTILLIEHLIGAFPYLLAFAAGAMIYVVVEELIPESKNGAHSNLSTIGFAVGFAAMMVLDVALG